MNQLWFIFAGGCAQVFFAELTSAQLLTVAISLLINICANELLRASCELPIFILATQSNFKAVWEELQAVSADLTSCWRSSVTLLETLLPPGGSH